MASGRQNVERNVILAFSPNLLSFVLCAPGRAFCSSVDSRRQSPGWRPFAAAPLSSPLNSILEIDPVAESVLNAIRNGIWNFEPEAEEDGFCPTKALPGTQEKLDVLAERVRLGLPLWHPEDRRSYNDLDDG